MARDVLVAGDTLVDFIPDREGPLAAVEQFRRRPGGSAANVAIDLARIDDPPWFWTRLSTDPFGEFLRDTLVEEDLPQRFVTRDPDAQTTLALVTHGPGGDPTFSFYRDGTADTRMTPGTVPDEVLADLSWIHATGVALSVEPARSALLELLARANDRGCTVSLDPNARPEMWASDETYAAVIRGTLPHVDVLVATADELRAAGFAGRDDVALAEAVLADGRGPHTVLATRGSEGACARARDPAPWAGEGEHGGYAVETVDTTGAGDAFTAAAVAAFTAGVTDLDAVLAAADAVAAVTTTEPGAFEALTGLAAVRDLHGPLPWERG